MNTLPVLNEIPKGTGGRNTKISHKITLSPSCTEESVLYYIYIIIIFITATKPQSQLVHTESATHRESPVMPSLSWRDV